jgi:hypothetical protein
MYLESGIRYCSLSLRSQWRGIRLNYMISDSPSEGRPRVEREGTEEMGMIAWRVNYAHDTIECLADEEKLINIREMLGT